MDDAKKGAVRCGPYATSGRKKYSSFPESVHHFCRSLEQPSNEKAAELAALHLLLEREHNLWKRLDHLKILIRVGPGLGLVGTLIPMGLAWSP